MKYLIGFLLCLIGFFSCKKAEVYPSDQIPHVLSSSNSRGVNRWGKFLLIGSKKFVTNKQTGQKIQYDDFGYGSRSSLRWGGSMYDIETIIRDTTTWLFYQPNSPTGNGRFVLNGDTTKLYMVNYTRDYSTIIEDLNGGQQNMGGSARPFTGRTLSFIDSTVAIRVQTDNIQLGGYSCEYFTELIFKKY